MQRFAGQLKADGAFKSVQALRAPDEAATSDYVLLHLQALLAEDDVRALLTLAKGQERARHPHAPSVKALPPDAALMTIVRTGALASKPRRGRRRLRHAAQLGAGRLLRVVDGAALQL